MSISIVTIAGKGAPLNAPEYDANNANLAAAIENVTTGHDHDGTGSKAIASLAPKANPVFSGLVSTAGQIAFTSTQNPSVDPNTLDDYEEGMWTAAVTSTGGTITTNTSYHTMSYIKIGRQVTITGEVQVSSVSSPTGALTITGLPFANQGGTELSARTGVSIAATNLETAAITAVAAYILPAATGIVIEVYEAGVLRSAAVYAKSSSAFRIGGTYFV